MMIETTREEVGEIKTPSANQVKGATHPLPFDMVHFLKTAKRRTPRPARTRHTRLPHGARKDRFGQVYLPVGIYYRRRGEKRPALYHCSATPHRVKIGTRPNPLRSIQTMYRGLTKKQRTTLARATKHRQAPVPIYKEYRYWDFTQVLPLLPQKRPPPIGFETFLHILERKQRGYTDFQAQIVGLIGFLLQTDFRYCAAYLRANSEGYHYGRTPAEPICLHEMVQAVCEVYRSSYQRPDHYARFQSIVTNIVRSHPKIETSSIYVSLGVGEFAAWPAQKPLIPMISISEREIPKVRFTQYEGTPSEYLVTPFPGRDPIYWVAIETVHLKHGDEEEEEDTEPNL